ncbi:MAG: hypothetical protein AAB913_02260 [Patescibacteria group bacterium]
MNNHKTIQDMFKSWGKNRQKIPLNNDVLKREILSKVPINFDREVSFKSSPFVWLSFTFAALAVFVLLINTTGYSNSVGSRQSIIQTESQMRFLPTSDVYKPNASNTLPYNGGELPVSDKREFLKVDYNATLRTRHIADLKNRIEIIIRGFNGRVDSSNSGDKNGYVSFAISKDNLESFKIEIKNLVGTRFYSEQTSSQNLLPAKQVIEENQRKTEKNLNDLQTERRQIVKNHNQNISFYQNGINFINTEINTLNIEYQSATVARRAEIINKISQLQTEISTIQPQIVNENKNYQTRISGIDIQIKNVQENLKTIQLQDSNLLDDVATVNGSISLNWINLWETADAYLPGPILAWIFFLAAFLTFLWYRYSIRRSYLDF